MNTFRARRCAPALAGALLALQPAAAALGQTNQMPDTMSGMASMHMPRTFLDAIEQHAGSGTSAEPGAIATPMWMWPHGAWMAMLHANVFVIDQQQTGPRGADKFFSTNWLMGMAQRRVGPGGLTLRAMLSLEPATITGERYPLLFQQGETAYGKPIVDGQHPHNFLMEVAALYDWRLTDRTLVSVYVAPIGDPAIGPMAYPHRASAAENPVAALGHHQQDSTHISFDVVTVGVTHGIVRVEASGFHGREPNEHRWEAQQGAPDSWSARLTLQPGARWSGQYSYARIKSLEQLYPSENQERMTGSVTYARRLDRGSWVSTAVWGRTRTLGSEGERANSYLLESTLELASGNNVWTRIEDADRTTELLNGEQALPAGFVERGEGKVQAYTVGYDREIRLLPGASTAIGAQATLYGLPTTLKPVYETKGGGAPAGVVIFMRLRPRGHAQM